MLEPYDSSIVWIVVVGFLLAFVLAFGLGANDVANSFGTSVGTKVLSLRQACIIASVCELAGSILIGSKVADTIRKDIVDLELFSSQPLQFMLASLSALGGASSWLILATFLKLPVSATHSIVGACIGYGLVAFGPSGINWKKLGMIVGSWFVSPLLSGIVSTLLFLPVNRFILQNPASFQRGLRALPVFYAGTLFVNILPLSIKGPDIVKKTLPLYGAFILSIGVSLMVALITYFFVVPYLRRRIENEVVTISVKECTPFSNQTLSPLNITRPTSISYTHLGDSAASSAVSSVCTSVASTPADSRISTPLMCRKLKEGKSETSPVEVVVEMEELKTPDSPTSTVGISSQEVVPIVGQALGTQTSCDTEEIVPAVVRDEPKTARLFHFLQILTACFGSFVHGGNDVSNSIGPLVTIWLTYTTASVVGKADVPIWVLVYGGFGIVVGLWIWGRRVIETVGENLVPLAPSSAFCIEIGSALTVLGATYLSLPVSTTHCKVGSVVCVGWLRSRASVRWSLFGSIIISWIVTVPASGLVSAGLYAGLRAACK